MLLLTPLTIRFSPQTAQKLQRKTIEKKYKHEIDVRSLFRSSPAVPRRAHTLPSFPFHRRSTRRPLPTKPSLNNGHVTLVGSPPPTPSSLTVLQMPPPPTELFFTPHSLSLLIYSRTPIRLYVQFVWSSCWPAKTSRAALMILRGHVLGFYLAGGSVLETIGWCISRCDPKGLGFRKDSARLEWRRPWSNIPEVGFAGVGRRASRNRHRRRVQHGSGRRRLGFSK